MTSLANQTLSETHAAAVKTILSTLIEVHHFDASQIKTDSESLEWLSMRFL